MTYIKAPAGRLITDSEYAVEQFVSGRASLSDLIETVGCVTKVATVEMIENFLGNSFMVKIKADESFCSPDTIVKQLNVLKAELSK